MTASTAVTVRKAAVSFTGGKDCMTVLHLLRSPEVALQTNACWPTELRDAWTAELHERLALVAGCEVTLLVTFVPAGGERSFKAHPLEVVALQAKALGLPHLVMEVAAAPTFLDSYRANITRLREAHGVEVLATGDMLDVCSSFMPRAAAGTGVALLSPLWDIPRPLLLELVWAYGMTPLITCVNTTKFRTEKKQGEEGAGEAPGSGAAAPGDGMACGRAEAAAARSRDAGAQPGAVAAAASTAVAGASAGAATDGGGAAAGVGGSDGSCGGTGGDGNDGGGGGLQLLGQVLDRRLHSSVLLPAVARYGVDEAGEWGEYHTMVTSSCLFARPLRLTHEVRQEGDYAYLALTAAELEQGQQ